MTSHDIYCASVDELLQRHGVILSQTIGKKIETSWVAWDELGNEWFTEEPIILRIGGTNYEFVFNHLDNLAITLNTQNLHEAPAWHCAWNDADDTLFRLKWKEQGLPELRALTGQIITNVRIIEYCFQGGSRQEAKGSWVLNGLEFITSSGSVMLYNALDENGVTSQKSEQNEHLRAVELVTEDA